MVANHYGVRKVCMYAKIDIPRDTVQSLQHLAMGGDFITVRNEDGKNATDGQVINATPGTILPLSLRPLHLTTHNSP